jgi:muramidase (phage lysozyme)
MNPRAVAVALVGGLALLALSRRSEAAGYGEVPYNPARDPWAEAAAQAGQGSDWWRYPETLPEAVYQAPAGTVEPLSAPYYPAEVPPAEGATGLPVSVWGDEWGDEWSGGIYDTPAEPYMVGDAAPYPIEPAPTIEPAIPADQAEANLYAIMAAIAAAEGTDPNPRGWNPYGVTVGYEFELDDFTTHPAQQGWPGNRLAGVLSTAAGKYQFLGSTWAEAQAALGLPDFGPESQESAAAWLILVKRKAGPQIAAGDLAGALAKLSWEWASLPPGRYGQPLRSADWIAAQYAAAGGELA